MGGGLVAMLTRILRAVVGKGTDELVDGGLVVGTFAGIR